MNQTRPKFARKGGSKLAASFVSIFLIPVLFYLVEKYSGKKPHPKKTEVPALAAPLAPPSI